MTKTFRNPSHLLVMENDPVLAHVLQALLAHWWLTCEIVPAKTSAMTGNQNRFDAILLGVQPAIEEEQAVIRGTRHRSPQPLVVMSEALNGEDRSHALDAGADFVIEKPFHPDELLACLRVLLRRRGSIKTLRAAG